MRPTTNTTDELPVQVLLRAAAERPDRPWLHQPVNGQIQVYTWAQVADQVRRMAAALQAMGLQPGSRIAITGRNTAHWIMADLAIAMAGHVSVGLYPKQSLSAVRYIFDHSEARVAFIGPMPDAQEFLATIPDGVVTIGFPYPGVPTCDLTWDQRVAECEPLAEYTPANPDELMTLIYTSGSTGDPKGVRLSYGNLMFASQGFIQVAPPPQDNDRLFSYLPLAHVFERMAIELVSLYTMTEVHLLEDLSKMPEELAKAAPNYMYHAVPLVLSRLQAGILQKMPQRRLELVNALPVVRGLVRRRILQALGLHETRMWVTGSAPLPMAVMEWFDKYLGVEICQGYGLSETALYATSNMPGHNKFGSVGRALPGVELKLSDADEVLLRHPAIMQGYYRSDEKTKEVLTADGWFQTGDKGRIDEDGYLFITGRIKEIFKTLKGKYVAPAPIEGALASNTDIDRLCLVGTGLNQPIMLVSLAPEARSKSRAELEKSLVASMKAVNANLEAHERIAKLVLVKDDWTIDNGLLTPTLKTKASAVESRYADLLVKEAATRNEISWE